MNQSNSQDINLGKYIRDIRISRSISTAQVATALKISERKYIQYEEGLVSIYIDHLVTITYILDVDIKRLLDAFKNYHDHTQI